MKFFFTMKNLFSVIIISIIFSGCSYHEASLDYAKQKKLSEDTYKNVKIQCVSKDYKDEKLISNINSIITSNMKILGNFQCDNNFKKLSMINPNYAKRSYKMCKYIQANSYLHYSKGTMDNSTFIDIIFEVPRQKRTLGYWGYEYNNDDLILFTHDVSFDKTKSIYALLLEKSVREYINDNKLQCLEINR